MINLDTSALGKMDTKTLEERMEEKKNLLVSAVQILVIQRNAVITRSIFSRLSQ